MLDIWLEVLEVEELGIDDEFLALGCDSLLAMTLVGQMNRELDAAVTLRMLFEAKTVSSLSNMQ